METAISGGGMWSYYQCTVFRSTFCLHVRLHKLSARKIQRL